MAKKKTKRVNTSDGLTDKERTMLGEIGAIVKLYAGKVRQFGVHLTHEHFEVKKGEVLHEHNDPLGRIQLTRPIAEKDLPKGSFVTSWEFDAAYNAGPRQWCCD